MTARRRSLLAVAAIASLTFASCSSDSTTSPAATSPAATSSAGTAAPGTETPSSASAATDTTGKATDTPRACTPPTTTTPVQAAAADSSGRDWDITSFDGTVIRAHWFPLPGLADDAVAPTVLMGPGWGSAGDTDVNSTAIAGVLNISTLRAAGFNVLTWDPRGFGKSTGTVEVDSPEYEGRDVQQLLDWVATQPQAELDGSRDPRVGMFGASYGGGIQLVTAAIDCRIDAIVPVIAWHSLQTSLFKADTAKTGWANFLAAASAGHQLDPTIAHANAAGNATGVIDPADAEWFAARGPGSTVDRISVPTLVIQGTVDTLFTLDEGVTNFEAVRGNGVPAAMVWFCGGHGACLTDPGNQSSPTDAAIAWLRRYVAEDTSVDPGPTFEFVDQDGVSYTADDFPTPTGSPLEASGTGTLQLIAGGGAGPAVVGGAGGLAPLVAPITPGRAANAVNVTVQAPTADTVLVGAPQLSITYSGSVAAGDRPTRVFAQLVDDATGIVLGNQITPIEVVLDGQPHTVVVSLEMIAFTAHPGSTITLQVVATTVSYATPRLGGSIDLQDITIELPVVQGVARVG